MIFVGCKISTGFGRDDKNFSVVEFYGGKNDQSSMVDSEEAKLDNQYILSVGYPTPVTEFSTGGLGELVVDVCEILPWVEDPR